ncbi:MAG: Crp/Fnr family transcriptional regulator [Deferrisomatales bacterium]
MDELSFSSKFVQTYQAGDLIFEEGSTGNEMYVVLSGAVGISRGVGTTRTELTTLGKGDVFGEMGLVEGAPRSATARATLPETRVVVIDHAKFVYLVSQQPAFALAIMQVLCQRIRALERRQGGP